MPARPATAAVRIAVDIGGTFTDLILDDGRQRHAEKRLTTHRQPAEAVIAGIQSLLERSALSPDAVGLVLHGTTLATNALIERRGARTALLTTAGHRDVLEMALENRFEQYDIDIDRPVPLVPRALRLPIRERIAADGSELLPLAEDDVLAALEQARAAGVESIAVGYLHAWRSGRHESATRTLIERHWPDVAVSLSSEVCPEIREYERFSTTCANAYVQPLMAHYLNALAEALADMGLNAPVRLMTSGGGLTTLETATAYPIRLVESGPAGGAMLAAHLARSHGADQVLAFDMGGTTAKLCLLDHGAPLLSRSFEVDRVYRFRKGSGLPLRIPVVEMVEIGAGGGSIAHLDSLGRLRVGPESAGSEPGPIAYGRGGRLPTVTDADLLLGRVDGEGFARAGLDLNLNGARACFGDAFGTLDAQAAAFRVAETVDENMAAASLAHAGEWGRNLEARTLIAFGGAAPVHAVPLAAKLGIERVLIPAHAGVGSALGFLLAPVRYEVVRSRFETLATLDVAAVAALLTQMRAEARPIVEAAGPGLEFLELCTADMRYAGQGFEISVPLDEMLVQRLSRTDVASTAATEAIAPPAPPVPDALAAAFTEAYNDLYGRTIPGAQIEIVSWTLSLSEPPVPVAAIVPAEPQAEDPQQRISAADCEVTNLSGQLTAARLLSRSALRAQVQQGPLLVTEAHTTTFVPAGYSVRRLVDDSLLIERLAEGARYEG